MRTRQAHQLWSRRQAATALATLAGAGTLGMAARAQAADARRELKMSHQFPANTDFRDRLCRKFAAEVERLTQGALHFEVFAQSSLMKTNAQFSAMRKGALDLSLYPLPYAGGEVVEANIALMPALVTSYEQGARWKTAEVGRLLNKVLLDKGIVLLSWVWQAGGVATKSRPILVPDDVRGVKVRGGSREFDAMLKAAGASVMTSIPSNEVYQAMQAGSIDAAYTSSASLVSFNLQELSRNFTSARKRTTWFMLEPLLMSKVVFDGLSKPQQDAVMAVGEQMETFAVQSCREDDRRAAETFAKAGNAVFDLDDAQIEKWRAVAQASAWKEFAERNETCAAMMASAVKLA